MVGWLKSKLNSCLGWQSSLIPSLWSSALSTAVSSIPFNNHLFSLDTTQYQVKHTTFSLICLFCCSKTPIGLCETGNNINKEIMLTFPFGFQTFICLTKHQNNCFRILSRGRLFFVRQRLTKLQFGSWLIKVKCA